MFFEPVDADCAQRPHGAQVFAFAAADTLLFGHDGPPLSAGFDHFDGSVGAMAGAGSALLYVTCCKAERLSEGVSTL